MLLRIIATLSLFSIHAQSISCNIGDELLYNGTAARKNVTQSATSKNNQPFDLCLITKYCTNNNVGVACTSQNTTGVYYQYEGGDAVLENQFITKSGVNITALSPSAKCLAATQSVGKILPMMADGSFFVGCCVTDNCNMPSLLANATGNGNNTNTNVGKPGASSSSIVSGVASVFAIVSVSFMFLM